MSKEISDAMKQRINMQYYADRVVSGEDYDKNIKSAPDFVLEIEKRASKITDSEIKQIRNKFQGLINKK